MYIRQRSKRRLFIDTLLVCFFLTLPRLSYAQQSNISILEDLAVRCLAGIPDTTQTFFLSASTQMPYLRTALVDRWLNEHRTIMLPDSAGYMGHPRLVYQIDEVRVDYQRQGRKRIQRDITLALRYSFTNNNGQLLSEERCTDSFTDVLDRNEVAAVESDAYPETKGDPPETGWVRRFLEPTVLTAATALTVYLFFSLRSDRAGSD